MTNEYRPDPYGGQDYPQNYGSTPVQQRSGSGNGLVIALVVLLVLLIAALALIGGWFLGNRGDGDAAPGAQTSAPNEAVVTSTVHAPAPSSAAPAPAPAAPAPSRSYSYGVAASANTSNSFANSVFNEFNAAYRASGTPNVTVTAYSPVTGTSYTMVCRDRGDYVQCTGGNNAVVNIS